MHRSGVRVVVIDEGRKASYLETGINRLVGGYDEREFITECHRVRSALIAALGEYWKHGVDHDTHFFIDDEFGPARFLSVEIARKEILTPRLVEIVHQTISQFDPDYCIDICDAWAVLTTEDGDPYPGFNVFVEKHQIQVYTESESLFERLALEALP